MASVIISKRGMKEKVSLLLLEMVGVVVTRICPEKVGSGQTGKKEFMEGEALGFYAGLINGADKITPANRNSSSFSFQKF